MVIYTKTFLTIEFVPDLLKDFTDNLDSTYLASISFGTPAQVNLLVVDSKLISVRRSLALTIMQPAPETCGPLPSRQSRL